MSQKKTYVDPVWALIFLDLEHNTVETCIVDRGISISDLHLEEMSSRPKKFHPDCYWQQDQPD